MSLLEELRKTNHAIRQHHPHEHGAPILRIHALSVRYDGYSALEDINFELNTGDQLAVLGPNGAGKSTLFKVIAGVLAPSEGHVHIFGHEPGGHICIAYVPQRSQVDWDFPVRVTDVVMMGRIGQMGLFRFPTANDRRIVSEALELVGLTRLAKRQISQLSGGQQQRMFIARALAQEAELILMDEPFSGLDLKTQEDIFEILNLLRQRAVTVLIAMHDLKMATERFGRVMLLNRQLIGLGAPEEVFAEKKLLEAYGGHLHLVTTADGLLALGDTCCDEGDV